MKTQIGTSNDGLVADSSPEIPVGMFHGIQRATAGSISDVRRATQLQIVANPVGHHGSFQAEDNQPSILS